MCWLQKLVRLLRSLCLLLKLNGSGYTNGEIQRTASEATTNNPLHFGFSSGDTGVSASLVLHGTPPFQVYYRTQRDKEPPRELSKTFASARGELTIQPERSGHYIFTFVQMSDANYRKVELKGPSIDQVVHPLATADFASGRASDGMNKRMISSCEGGLVSVDVDLRVSGLCLDLEKTIPLIPSFMFTLPGDRSMESGGPSSGSQELRDFADSWYRRIAKDSASSNTESG
jgi:hypothetical protein